ncbi:uncharacterized protein LOC107831036 [Nicotiana tabacum]|uniref:Uncharacterized protein LOC107831036 n=3 Tax=Nicotiana TaxID=4085 RepID=A0A1S4DLF3_TOBAC|nr:PREDICTED: inactive protein RESTRICTED TEV MOVEMENT 2-like [Nicotiana sylvestris]
MNSKGASAATPTQIYEDFVPTSKLVQEELSDTLHLNIPGFKKEQVRVQLTKTGILKISGERPIRQNKRQRFQKDFPVAENCDKSKISAKFENGILHVKQPKLITSTLKKDKELPASEAENTPAKRQKTSLRDELTKQDNADINNPAKEPAKEEQNNPAKEPAKEEQNNTSPKTSEQTEGRNIGEKSLADKSSSSSSYSESESDESSDDSTDDETTGNASCLAANPKKPRKMMKMTLVALLILGSGVYVANMMKSANEAEEMDLVFM